MGETMALFVRITATLTLLLGFSMLLGFLPREMARPVHIVAGLGTILLAFVALRGLGPRVPLARFAPWLFVLALLAALWMSSGGETARGVHMAIGVVAVILLEVVLAKRRRAAAKQQDRSALSRASS